MVIKKSFDFYVEVETPLRFNINIRAIRSYNVEVAPRGFILNFPRNFQAQFSKLQQFVRDLIL